MSQSKSFHQIHELCQEALNLLREPQHNRLIVTASPGAGKTTQIPWALTQITQKKILVLEPRRIAAVSAADFISRNTGNNLGEKIGYQVRFENKTSPQTQLIFLTEALLLRKLVKDPQLSDVGVVVLDEFHERSVDLDLALGCLTELQSLSRPDLKIVVMSATLETEKLKTYLEPCTHLDVATSQHLLNVIHQKEPQSLSTDRPFIERVSNTIKSAFHEKENYKLKSALVFLPGVGEIERVAEELQTWSSSHTVPVLKLHGNIPLKEQREIVQPSVKPRVILATNIAESSLTVNGVNMVIDSGLTRSTQLNFKTNLTRLLTERSSLFSARQRAGRANRQEPGTVIKMWNKTDELSMKQVGVPEIHRTLLDEAFLFLSSLGVNQWKSFSWFEIPNEEIAKKSIDRLLSVGAVFEDGAVTETGHFLLKYPLPLKLGRILIESEKLNKISLAVDICAILSEREFMEETDIYQKLQTLWEHRKKPSYNPRIDMVDKVADQLMSMVKAPRVQHSYTYEDVITLILPFYKERVCLKRPQNNTAICFEGYGLRLGKTTQIKEQDFFVALDLFETPQSPDPQASVTMKVSKEQIKKYFQSSIQKKTQIVLDEKSQDFFVEETSQLGAILFERHERRRALAKEVEDLLPQYLHEHQEKTFEKNESAKEFIQKIHFIEKITGENVFTDEMKKELLDLASYGESSLQKVYEKDFSVFFEQLLGKEKHQKLEKDFPSALTSPKGKRVVIHYSLDKDPFIEIKIQDAFGWKETPKIAGGKAKLTVVLLAPNMRPTQVTQDLAYFWKNSYQDVRKELRARYPKHSWPEDPSQ